MEMLFVSCLVSFTMTYVWNWMSVRRVCFDSEVLGTSSACSSRVDVSSTTVPVNFCPPSGGNPSCGVEPPRGNPYNVVRFALAFEWEKSHQWSCEASL